MYDIRQFKPTLFLVLLLGLSGFCVTGDALGLWGISLVAVALNAWLVKTNRFHPFPRWLANAITLAAVGYIIREMRADEAPPLLHVGQFLVLLHLIKLYEQRSNRDYAQLLVLSLLLMVAAAINSTSLAFALFMLIYLAMSLYCCLLFHLKVEAERAREALLGVPEENDTPSTLRQDQRFLPNSMRRLTAIVWTVAVAVAALVFLFFPRGTGAGLFGQIQLKPNTALTGLSDHLDFEQITRIKQSEDVVARVSVTKDNAAVEGGTLYLRSSTLDVYGGIDSLTGEPTRQWVRSPWLNDGGNGISQDSLPRARPQPPDAPVWRQHVILEPTGLRYLIALPGLMHYPSNRGRLAAVSTGGPVMVQDYPADDALQLRADQGSKLEYDVYSTNSPQVFVPGGTRRGNPRGRPLSNPEVLTQVRQYALRLLPEEIAGRLRLAPAARVAPEERDRIARIFEHHLRSEFSYTLDLTDSKALFRGLDPVVAFLTRVKKGSCTYFASAMTLMCQSIDIPARLVQGFRCDEFNTFGDGYFIVRASQAHAWVEVLTPAGWATFDPTSSREAPAAGNPGLWGTIKHFFDYLEYKWAESVVAYDAHDRDRIVRGVSAFLVNLLISVRDFFRELGKITYSTAFWTASLSVLNLMLWALCLSLVGAIVWFFVQRYRLRRRAARIGLESLPAPRRIRLARQLAFYDRLMRLLYRMDIERPHYLTNLEFSQSLVHLPTRTYNSIQRLTELFYRVRFGGFHIPPSRQRRLENIVLLLGRDLFTPRRR